MNNGATAELGDPSIAAAKHRLTVVDFRRMAAAGILDDDDRVELIEGELFDMAPIGSKHASIVDALVELLTLGARGRALVRAQGPLEIPPYSEPLPDVLLLKPRTDRYRDALPQPADVLLIIEVADSTLARDRDLKIPLYSRHGIPESWLVDVQRQVITVYQQPSGEGYRHASEIGAGSLAPGCLPDVAVGLSDLFG
jgi:Uma2 family endonuclease